MKAKKAEKAEKAARRKAAAAALVAEEKEAEKTACKPGKDSKGSSKGTKNSKKRKSVASEEQPGPPTQEQIEKTLEAASTHCQDTPTPEEEIKEAKVVRKPQGTRKLVVFQLTEVETKTILVSISSSKFPSEEWAKAAIDVCRVLHQELGASNRDLQRCKVDGKLFGIRTGQRLDEAN